MATYDQELLAAAGRLIARRKGQPGKLASARVRRSISTSYYALFHFLLDDACRSLLGTSSALRTRRRILARAFTHVGVKVTFDKVKGANVHKSVVEFLRDSGRPSTQVLVPVFVQGMASAFLDAYAKRTDADYNLNEQLSETDARLLRNRIRRAISNWRDASSAQDKQVKHALYVLMLLKGKLGPDS